MKAKLITRTNPMEFEKDMNILLERIDDDLVDIEFSSPRNEREQHYSALVIYKEKTSNA
ncbi:sporulation protein Cse60 [Sporolactobacillus pectinivorans]|uniref:sporulation protein Cse60 n=1 Tax=Sporolactobacillus pectinivorans TaxID=1591408 RepID=UPI0012FD8995|nr:sporulation protein Cse60 [Sporolactobacillus pectinivorans]